MKYSILGFNQSKIMETELDLTDLVILNYIMQACGTPKMKHILDGNEYPLVWIHHKKLSEDLPILRISEGTLRNRLTKLKQGGYISSKTVCGETVRGTRTYYGLTELTMSFIYDVENSTMSLKNDVEDRACHSKMTSNNILNTNNILNNTIPKGIVEQNPLLSTNETHEDTSVTEELSDYEKHMFSDDVKKKRKIVQAEDKPKQKRLSLWDKCVQAIEEYTDDPELRNALTEYLKLRLEIKDKPIYANQWKGLLNKLQTLTGDPVQIVKRSTELGYASFYELQEWKNKSRKPDPRIFGEYEEMSCEKVSKEKREELLKNGKKF